MAKNSQSFEVGCPCCGATIKVDPAVKAVIAHTPPPEKKMFSDFEEAERALREQNTRRESLFERSVAAQKQEADIREKKFQEAVRRAKETPDTGRPLRDFDLD
jgi:hypothetical protein